MILLPTICLTHTHIDDEGTQLGDFEWSKGRQTSGTIIKTILQPFGIDDTRGDALSLFYLHFVLKKNECPTFSGCPLIIVFAWQEKRRGVATCVHFDGGGGGPAKNTFEK